MFMLYFLVTHAITIRNSCYIVYTSIRTKPVHSYILQTERMSIQNWEDEVVKTYFTIYYDVPEIVDTASGG
jgi:hypothetical protein